MNSELIIYKKCEAQVKRYCLLNNNQGLERYFRDPGFDQNGSRDSENAKYLEGKRDLTATQEAGFIKIWARDAGLFSRLSGIREIVRSSSECETACERSVVCPIKANYKCFQEINRADRSPTVSTGCQESALGSSIPLIIQAFYIYCKS